MRLSSIADILLSQIRGHLRRCTLDARAFAPIVVGTVPLGNGPNTERVGESSMQRQGFGYQGITMNLPVIINS